MLSRRRFLAASVASLPLIRSVAANQPKDKVRLAVIGLANRAAANLAGVEMEHIVALCDVDPAHAVKARKQFPDAAFYTDYRKMLDEMANKIDAVVVSTPDHSHTLPAVTAMRLGKHVYCEKPLAHTVEEVRLMRTTALEKKVITQMGTQIHAGDNYRRVVEIVQSGSLGAVNRVHVWLGSGPPLGKKVAAPTPKMDLDLWLGSVTTPFFTADHPNTPHKGHTWPHFHWRYWWEFGGGQLADFGCHFMDLPFWALGLGAPTKVKATGSPLPDADNTVPGKLQVDYTFPGVHLTWYHGVPGPDLAGNVKYDGFGSGVLFEGEKAKLLADYGKLRLLPDEFAKSFKAPAPTIAKSIGHHKEWLDAIRGTGKALCEFGYAGLLTEAVLLGNVAYRSGKELDWDHATGKTNAVTANEFLRTPIRKGWELS